MSTNTASEFDSYAEDYEQALEKGLRYSGEDSAYFARGRIEWLGRRLAGLDAPRERVLDFGCGTGSATPLLLEILGAERVIGTDVSRSLLRRARAEHGSDRSDFLPADEAPEAWADVAYCNGVFHHIAPEHRAAALSRVLAALRPRGLFALWENNPWNPGTRWVMRRIEFDRDAVTLTPPAARRMLSSVGFEVLSTDSLFYFPRPLRALRKLESRLTNLPLGAQYMVLARRAQ
ncbi:MAG: class I SAM-dependent methyltransferase [Solirubrobacterales bacterium]|nr:class I SAM-dependent methyltransferase [Solirubrobacterales bacterium]MBV9473724.1 class I SAM-dependent methyltransferase [Solirubrobacterales bacterium]MBV9838057.1 class I SAM-dependent methyltransferase [Solirubrobacterales bacterium]